MKKTSKLFKLVIALAVACIAIVLLEVFNLHPQLNVGDMHFYWVGVKKMNFESSGPMIIPLTNGKTEIYKEHNFVLLTVVSTEDI